MNSAGFEYLAYGPKGDGPRKLVILLHGYGRNACYMEKMAEEVHRVMPGVIVLCPHAPEPLDHSRFTGGKTDFFRAIPDTAGENAGNGDGMLRQWFAIKGNAEQLFLRMQPAASRLNAFIDLQRGMAGVEEADIALMGFSQGAALALYAGLTRTAGLGCVVCHSSIVLDGMRGMAASAPPVYFIHGTNDREFPAAAYDDSFASIQKLTGNRAQAAIVEGLGHSTSAESRRLCAAYIMNKLLP